MMAPVSLILFVIGQLAWLATAYLYPFVLAAQNHVQIEANGSLDTLKKKWHRLNVILWVLTFVPVGLLAVLPVALTEGMYIRSLALYVSMMALGRAWHWWAFDKFLSYLRNKPEDYIGENADSDLFLKKHPNAKRTALVVGVLLYITSITLLFI